MCMDAFSVDEMKERSLKSVQITYVKQCKYGEKLEFFRRDDGEFSYIEGRVDGEARVRMKMSFFKN